MGAKTNCMKISKVVSGTIYPFGIKRIEEGLHISYPFGSKTDCGIVFFPGEDKEQFVSFPRECFDGLCCNATIYGKFPKKFSYSFSENGILIGDRYAKYGNEKRKWMQEDTVIKQFKDSDFVWHSEETEPIPFSEKVFYMLHVRGFTMHRSSGVTGKGTFLGIQNKFTYLKELGITSLVLMPVYDFCEKITGLQNVSDKVNYWGYTKASYYRVKDCYAYSNDASREFKELVDLLHQNKMEIFCQFYFPQEMSTREKLDVLFYWRKEYRIDGIELIGSNELIDEIQKESALYGLQVLADDVNRSLNAGSDNAFMNEEYLYQMRSFLKADSNKAADAMRLMRMQHTERGCLHPYINYFAKQNTMRLYDCTAYHRKYNEANGEDNQDGPDENFSWNYGVEGITKKKSIQNIRLKQLKNALAMLMFSQGTPLLYSGDEFGNSQYGNNNPYCQDNEISYIKWNQGEFGRELEAFTKELIKIRKQYKIFHTEQVLTGQDPLNSGYPDISIHGDEAWKTSGNMKGMYYFAILYQNRYADPSSEELLYLAINMYWDHQNMALPRIGRNKMWEIVLQSDEATKIVDARQINVAKQSIILLRAVNKKEK